MNKISLKSLNLKEVEQLTREALKNVLGGYTGGTGDVTDDGGTTDDRCLCKCDHTEGSWFGTETECEEGSGTSSACGTDGRPGPYTCK